MNIKATGRIDKESVRTLNRVSVYGRRNPRVRFTVELVLYSLLILVLLALGFISGFESFIVAMLGICAVALILILYMYFIMPLISIKATGKLLGVVNTYEFRDEDFYAQSASDALEGTSTTKYTMLKKVVETEKYLFLIQSNNASLIVEKGTVCPGEMDALREKLKSVVPKYFKCKY